MGIKIDYAIRDSFEEAAAEAGHSHATAFVMPSVLDMASLPDFLMFTIAAFAVIHAERGNSTNPVHVLDFGGASGFHRTYIGNALCGRFPLDWTVVETEAARAFYEPRIDRSETIRFATTLDGVPPVDVAYFSGVLQCLPDWREPLQHQRVRTAPYIIVTRTPVAESEIPFLQTVVYDDKTVLVPGRVLCKSDLFAQLNETHKPILGCEQTQIGAGNRPHIAPAMLWKLRS